MESKGGEIRHIGLVAVQREDACDGQFHDADAPHMSEHPVGYMNRFPKMEAD